MPLPLFVPIITVDDLLGCFSYFLSDLSTWSRQDHAELMILAAETREKKEGARQKFAQLLAQRCFLISAYAGVSAVEELCSGKPQPLNAESFKRLTDSLRKMEAERTTPEACVERFLYDFFQVVQTNPGTVCQAELCPVRANPNARNYYSYMKDKKFWASPYADVDRREQAFALLRSRGFQVQYDKDSQCFVVFWN